MKSLCCMRLQTAGKFVGWLYLGYSLFMLAYLFSFLVYVDMKFNIFGNDKHGEALPVSLVFLCVCIGISLLSLIASAFLLHGISKQNHLMLLPCLITLVLEQISFVVGKIMIWKELMEDASTTTIIILIVSFLICAFLIYIYIGILSMYNQIRLNRDEQESNKLKLGNL